MRRMTAAGVLLMVPIAALLWVESYAKVEPVLLRFPFFYPALAVLIALFLLVTVMGFWASNWRQAVMQKKRALRLR